MRLDTKNPYRVIFWIAVATIFASLSVAVLVGQFGRRTTDPFFTDNPTRRLSDADVAAIAIKFDDAKSNNHGRLRLGLHNDVMVLDDHICGDICPDYTVSIVHYDAEPGAACERIGGVTVDAVRSEEHTSELQSLMRISSDVLCLTKKKNISYT